MKYSEIYLKFRWIVYNNLEISQALNYNDFNNFMVKEDKFQYYAYQLENNINLDLIPDGFENHYVSLKTKFNSKDFEVKKELIDQYDAEKIFPFINKIKIGEVDKGYFHSSSFIEKIKIPLNPNKFEDFKVEVFERMLLYYYWNFLDKDEVFWNIINFKFLTSTIKLISKEKLFKYLTQRFKSLDEFFIFLLSNFTVDENWKLDVLNEFLYENNEKRIYNYLNNFYMYDWFFGNEFKRSMRIFENEVRIDNNIQTIGSFYNEDILFKSVFLQFGHKYKVVAQGAPNWLKPQRLDVFIPELNIGIEYQGEQHFRPVDFGGKGREIAIKQFIENVKRDNIKKQKCLDNGCLLLEMKFDDDLNQFLNNLKNEIQKIGNGY